jgi:sugar phosphate isomerase/epimerase
MEADDMARPITIFTGQWTDLPFKNICEIMSNIGYDGLEIACWGDHLNVKKAAEDYSYVKEKNNILKKYNLGCWAIGQHLSGQCVGDLYDKRHDNFVPSGIKGNPEKIREWAIQDLKYSAKAAKNIGAKVITGFTGSPIWKFFYSFPQTSEDLVEEGYKKIYELWSPIFDEFDRQGVKFALEVHPTEIAYDFYTTKRFLEAFNYRPTVGINFDPSHLYWQGIKPHLFIREFKDRIYHVHMKDVAVNNDGYSGILGSHITFGDRKRGWNFRSLGHGDINFEEIIRELNSINYTGPLSIEWEDTAMDRFYGALESLNFTKKMNFKPNQTAFDKAMSN